MSRARVGFWIGLFLTVTVGNAVFALQSYHVIDAATSARVIAKSSACAASARTNPECPGAAATSLLAPGEVSGYDAMSADQRKTLVRDRAALFELAIVALALAGLFGLRPSTELRRRLFSPTEVMLLIVQIGVVVVGAVGGVVHIIYGNIDKQGHYTPGTDAVALGYFAFALVGALLPRLQKFGFAGATFEMTAEKAAAVTTDVAGLLDNWISALNILLIQIEHDPEPGETIKDFLADRGDEASQAMATPGEYLRVSYWNYVAERGGLALLQATLITDEDTKNHVFPYGKGCMGRAFKEQRMWNEDDPRSLSSWIHIPGTPNDFNALLLVPITWEAEKIGMLAIDREAKQKFGDTAQRIASALANLAANALGSPITKRALQRVTDVEIVDAESSNDGERASAASEAAADQAPPPTPKPTENDKGSG